MLPTLKIATSNSSNVVNVGQKFYSTIAARSYLKERRRELEKKNYVGKLPDPEARLLRFPNMRLGNDYYVNYKLIRYGVTPLGDNAYRNLHARHLLMKASGKIDEFKALHYEGQTADDHKCYFAASSSANYSIPAEVEKLDVKSFSSIVNSVAIHLSDANDLYMTDAAAGSNRYVHANIRAITNNPNSTLYLSHLLSPTSAKLDSFKHDIIIWHSPDYVLNAGDFGLKKHKSYSFFGIVTGDSILNNLSKDELKHVPNGKRDEIVQSEAVLLVLCGTESNQQLRSSLTTLSDYVHLRNRRLSLEASILKDSNGKSVLVFDPSGILVEGNVHKNLFSSQNSLWCENGIYRTFESVTHSNLSHPRNRGDIVEKLGKSYKITQKINFSETSAESPKAVIFLLRDSTSTLPPLAKMNAQEALHFFNFGYDGKNNSPFFIPNRVLLQPGEGLILGGFQSLVQNSRCPTYVVNVNTKTKELSREQLDKIFASILNGTAENVTSTPVNGLGMSAIKKVSGLENGELDGSKGWKNKQEHNNAITELGKKFGIKSI